jgi:hypothetical protein
MREGTDLRQTRAVGSGEGRAFNKSRFASGFASELLNTRPD